jgi:hypothetical protein
MPTQKELREAGRAVQVALDTLTPSEDSPREIALRRHLEDALLALEELTRESLENPMG